MCRFSLHGEENSESDLCSRKAQMPIEKCLIFQFCSFLPVTVPGRSAFIFCRFGSFARKTRRFPGFSCLFRCRTAGRMLPTFLDYTVIFLLCQHFAVLCRLPGKIGRISRNCIQKNSKNEFAVNMSDYQEILYKYARIVYTNVTTKLYTDKQFCTNDRTICRKTSKSVLICPRNRLFWAKSLLILPIFLLYPLDKTEN